VCTTPCLRLELLRLFTGLQLIPHADVIFLNRTYAQAQSPAYANAPRAFLLTLTRLAPPHALLVAYWGTDSAAVLSVPTREYFQSSGWTAPPTPVVSSSSFSSSAISASTNATPTAPRRQRTGVEEGDSVRTGSGFWAAGHDSSHGSSAFSASLLHHLSTNSATSPQADDSGDDSDGTEIAAGSSNDGTGAARATAVPRSQQTTQQQQQQQQQHQQHQQQAQPPPQKQQPQQPQQQQHQPRVDDTGAQDAFVAGMIYALSRRLLPGAPYAPGLAGVTDVHRSEGGRWKLDECLRCACRGPNLYCGF
jgi:hypothetical protein